MSCRLEVDFSQRVFSLTSRTRDVVDQQY